MRTLIGKSGEESFHGVDVSEQRKLLRTKTHQCATGFTPSRGGLTLNRGSGRMSLPSARGSSRPFIGAKPFRECEGPPCRKQGDDDHERHNGCHHRRLPGGLRQLAAPTNGHQRVERGQEEDCGDHVACGDGASRRPQITRERERKAKGRKHAVRFAGGAGRKKESYAPGYTEVEQEVGDPITERSPPISRQPSFSTSFTAP
jgi:hypothetical protein